MTHDDSSITNSPISASMSPCVRACVCVIAHVHLPAWSFILIMTYPRSKKHVLIDAYGLVIKCFFSVPLLRLHAAINRRRAAAEWDQRGLLRGKDQEGPTELDPTAPVIVWPDGFHNPQRCQDVWPLSEAQLAGHWRHGQAHTHVEPTFFWVRNQMSEHFLWNN